MPFDAGPFKFAPYITWDVAYYSQDVNGDSQGRLFGGGGLRWSMPLSKLYPDIESDLLQPQSALPQDRSFTATTTRPRAASASTTCPNSTASTTTPPIRPCATFAPSRRFTTPPMPLPWPTRICSIRNISPLRRLVDNSSDTLDTMNVVQLGIDQRWQTKRGFPGDEHVVDWMSLNVMASIFPIQNATISAIPSAFWSTTGYGTSATAPPCTATAGSSRSRGGRGAFDFGACPAAVPTQPIFYTSAIARSTRWIPRPSSPRLSIPSARKYAITAKHRLGLRRQCVESYSLLVSRMGTDMIWSTSA